MRKFVVVLMSALVLLLSAASVSYAEGRWVLLGHTEGMDVCYDTQTVEYDPGQQTITYWLRFARNGENVSMDRTRVYLSTKKKELLKYVTYSHGYPKVGQPAAGKRYLYDVEPDGFDENAADSICDTLHIAHMYPNRATRWKWLSSTDTETYSYATDCNKIDYQQQEMVFWVRRVNIQYPNSPGYSKYTCRFDAGTLYYEGGKGVGYIEVLPDTFAETVWNKAKSLYAQGK